jgi:hypothetical protein
VSETSAPRMRRPSWRDPRLGVGILLVVASVALGSWAVARAGASIEVYQARVTMTPGDTIDVDDLQVVQVRLDDVDSIYLLPGSDLVPGAVVTRTVARGELVPLAALGSPDDVDVRPVQVPMSTSMTDVVTTGTRVDLWVALPDPASPQGALLPPEELVSDLEVRAVDEDTSVFAGSDQVQVQVLVRQEDIPDVLAAVSSEGLVTVVPAPGGGVG